MSKRKRIYRKIHNAILYILNSIAALGMILSAMASGAEGAECIVALVIFCVCAAWLCAVSWANMRLGNW